MKTVNTFALSKLTDSDLFKLAAECMMEQERREEARRTRRKTWIRDYHSAFLRHPNATYKVLGETVVVSVYDRYTGIHMGATAPCGEDKFELSTGIAVAFAKAMGERIPEFI
jgi:hypothetical protein